MAKCRVIDRIAYTKGELKFINDSKTPTEKPLAKDPQHTLTPSNKPIDMSEYREAEHKGDKCPMCGQYTLHHVEGCETCHACGYSKCAISW